MQVNSVASNSVQSFGNKQAAKREYLERFAQLSDKDLRTVAYTKAGIQVNDKKHKRISNAIFYSIPLAAGLAAAIKTPSTLFKANRLRGAKIANFAATALSWAGTFAVIDLVFGAKHKIEKHSATAKKFTQEHPIMSTLAGIGAAVGALFLGSKGISKLAGKAGNLGAKELRTLSNINSKLNNNKVLNKVAENVAKVPSAIKNFAKGVIELSPLLLVVSSITHSINHSNAKTRQTFQNYNELKNAQTQIREALEAEDNDRIAEADDLED